MILISFADLNYRLILNLKRPIIVTVLNLLVLLLGQTHLIQFLPSTVDYSGILGDRVPNVDLNYD